MPFNRKEYMKNYFQTHKEQYKPNRRNDYLRHKEKRLATSRAWQKNNPEKFKNIQREFKKKHRLETIQKLGSKCVNCGNPDIEVLEFHEPNGHENYLNKNFDISKVILLCANCHTKETRRGI